MTPGSAGQLPVMPVWISFAMCQLAYKEVGVYNCPLKYLMPYAAKRIKSISVFAPDLEYVQTLPNHSRSLGSLLINNVGICG